MSRKADPDFDWIVTKYRRHLGPCVDCGRCRWLAGDHHCMTCNGDDLSFTAHSPARARRIKDLIKQVRALQQTCKETLSKV